MFCDLNYATYKETINSVGGFVATLGGKLLTCSSKTQRNVTLRNTEEDYMALSGFTQDVKCVSTLLVEMNEVKILLLFMRIIKVRFF